MLHSRETPILPRNATRVLVRIPLPLLLFVTLRLSQKAQQKDERSLPKYDLHTGTKINGVVEELNLFQKSTDTLRERIPARSFL